MHKTSLVGDRSSDPSSFCLPLSSAQKCQTKADLTLARQHELRAFVNQLIHSTVAYVHVLEGSLTFTNHVDKNLDQGCAAKIVTSGGLWPIIMHQMDCAQSSGLA